MANQDQVATLKRGVEAWNNWNTWRYRYTYEVIDLRGANVSGANLSHIDLRWADLSGADLSGAELSYARLRGANLTDAVLAGAILTEARLGETTLTNANLLGANLSGTDLSRANLNRAILTNAILSGATLNDANLTGANLLGADLSNATLCRVTLRGAILSSANLSGANLSDADLSRVSLQQAVLVRTELYGADLSSCRIYGIAAWDLKLDQATEQAGLVITPPDQPTITVDNLEVAQFVYLLLNNQRIRDVIDTIGKKAVLILGRFTDERNVALDALRDELRRRDYLPIVFDFDKPASGTLTDTIRTLAGMARFVIADLTDARSLPQELMAIVPTMPLLAVQPLVLAGASEYALFEFFRHYPWVLPTYQYETPASLLDALSVNVIAPAEAKVAELRGQTPPTS
jgi:uncharacterized protein YjbI with pentapeptide repeats